MEAEQKKITLIEEAERRLYQLSPERLRVAVDFLAYLQEREENDATEELLSIPGFEDELREAQQQAETGEVVPFDKNLYSKGNRQNTAKM